MNDTNVEKILLMTEQDLFTSIGNDLQNISLRADEHTPKDSEKMGRKWFTFNKQQLLREICFSEKIVKFLIEEKTEEKVELVTAVSDVIVGLCGGISVISVSALLVKAGLKSLCSPVNPKVK